jgi:nitrile hydratase
VVVELHGTHPVPADVARGLPSPRVGVVYAVGFGATELWGVGDHEVVVDLWEQDLVPSDGEDA